MSDFIEISALTCTKSDTVAPLYSSLPLDTPEQKKLAFNAIANPDGRITELINQKILLTNIMCEMVTMVNEESGEEETAPRIILIDDKGKSYQAVSWGLRNSLNRVIAFYGWPHEWTKPIPILIQQIETKKGRTFSIKLA